jgi:hypothetical protein
MLDSIFIEDALDKGKLEAFLNKIIDSTDHFENNIRCIFRIQEMVISELTQQI